MPVAQAGEIKTGEAVILSNVDGETVREYRCEITKIYGEGGEYDRCMTIRITDPELLRLTGGIVQGMGVIDNRDNTKKPVNNRFSAVTLKLTMI